MKVIVTGSTGLAGAAVVRRCIANDKITKVFALARKGLPADVSGNPKVTVIRHDDFNNWTPELMAQLAGAEACIWTLGGRATQFPDIETATKVSVDFTLSGARAMIADLAPKLPAGQKFRFVFCSGFFAEWDQNKTLFFLGDTRRIKGMVEKGLCDLADANDRFSVIIARPSAILPAKANIVNRAVGKLYAAIGCEHLADGMIKLVLGDAPSTEKDRIVENSQLLAM